jgi:parallel beta-helix repeat protein
MTNWIGKHPWKFIGLCLAAVLFLGFLESRCCATTYYLDASATGANDGGLGNDAFQTWGAANAALHALPGDGAGDTLVVAQGYYGDIGDNSVLEQSRSDWLTISAADGAKAEFGKVLVKRTPATAADVCLWFDGIRFVPATQGKSVELWYANRVRFTHCYHTSRTLDYEGLYAPYVRYRDYAIGIFTSTVNDLEVAGCEFTNLYRGIWADRATGAADNYRWVIEGCWFHRIVEDATEINYQHGLAMRNNRLEDFNRRYGPCYFVGSLQGTKAFVPGERVVQAVSNAPGVFHEQARTAIYVFQTTAKDIEKSSAYATAGITGLASGAVWNTTRPDYAHNDGIGSHYQVSDWLIAGNTLIGKEILQGITFSPSGGGNNCRIENNLIYGSMDKGIYICGGSGVCINNNTLYDSPIRFDIPTAGPGPVISELHNNIVYKMAIDPDIGAAATVFLSHGNNIFGDNPNGKPAGGATPFIVNDTEKVSYPLAQLFVNAAGADFNLAPDSVAVDAGNGAYGPKMDMAGNPRDTPPDIGVLEYLAPLNLPPVYLLIEGELLKAGTTVQLRIETGADLPLDILPGMKVYRVVIETID